MNARFIICCFLIVAAFCEEIPSYANPAKLYEGQIIAIVLGVVIFVVGVVMVLICCFCHAYHHA